MPGTKVVLLNLDTKEQVTYTIFGPWDGNPDKNIISYTAPLVQDILGSKAGTTVVVKLGKNEIPYKIKSIEKAI